MTVLAAAGDAFKTHLHSFAWIDPHGKIHEIHGDTHGQWAFERLKHTQDVQDMLNGINEYDADYDEDGFPNPSQLALEDAQGYAHNLLTMSGWVACGNAYNFTWEAHTKLSKAAMDTCLDLVVRCAKHLGTDPDEPRQVHVDDGFDSHSWSVAEFVDMYGGRAWTERLFKTLLGSATIRGVVLASLHLPEITRLARNMQHKLAALVQRLSGAPAHTTFDTDYGHPYFSAGTEPGHDDVLYGNTAIALSIRPGANGQWWIKIGEIYAGDYPGFGSKAMDIVLDSAREMGISQIGMADGSKGWWAKYASRNPDFQWHGVHWTAAHPEPGTGRVPSSSWDRSPLPKDKE